MIRREFFRMATVCITSTLALSPAAPAQSPSRAEIDRRAAAALALATVTGTTGTTAPATTVYADALDAATARKELVAVFVGTAPRPLAGCVSCAATVGGEWSGPMVFVGVPGGNGLRFGVDVTDPALLDAASRLRMPAAVPVVPTAPVAPAYYPPPVYYPAQAFGGWAGGGNCVGGRCH